MPSTLLIQKSQVKNEIKADIYNAFLGFSGGLNGLSEEDQQAVKNQITDLATKISDSIVDRVYVWIKNSVSPVITPVNGVPVASLPAPGFATGIRVGEA
jgi:hypothetical protein